MKTETTLWSMRTSTSCSLNRKINSSQSKISKLNNLLSQSLLSIQRFKIRRLRIEEFKLLETQSSMMTSQIMKNPMNMVANVSIAGSTSPRLREVSLTHSSSSHQLVESMQSRKLLITPSKPFSTTKTIGSTWTHQDQLTR